VYKYFNALKLAPLLAQYLYTNKRLDLPGFGTFHFDSSLVPIPENKKQESSANMQGVTFENNNSIKESPDLINFISAQTGKIKALASADLESYLELAQQFLNIGKPYMLEGIGSLVKVKSGEFAFTSGQIMPEGMKDYSAREISSTSSTEESFSDHKNIFNLSKAKVKWRKPVAFLLVVAGIALAVWGGYTIYKKTTSKDNPVTTVPKEDTIKEEKNDETVLITDTAKYLPPQQQDTVKKKDSVIVPVQTIQLPSGTTKFVLEISPAKRAFERLAKLKAYLWDVKMETKDSINYKLFMLLPATAADTTRMMDSLTLLNGKRVYIEH
jgi:hypothetical protein